MTIIKAIEKVPVSETDGSHNTRSGCGSWLFTNLRDGGLAVLVGEGEHAGYWRVELEDDDASRYAFPLADVPIWNLIK